MRVCWWYQGLDSASDGRYAAVAGLEPGDKRDQRVRRLAALGALDGHAARLQLASDDLLLPLGAECHCRRAVEVERAVAALRHVRSSAGRENAEALRVGHDTAASCVHHDRERVGVAFSARSVAFSARCAGSKAISALSAGSVATVASSDSIFASAAATARRS
ncbi:hypothetical protein M885DRAFT_535803 [Pelagophyceae sp. CCMP2097]|nr:hypothetical protein M885DRAFT_535803 [Pelagophyceae sp. CCMP2097]